VVHVEANWHHHTGFGVVEETQWIQQLDFKAQGLKLSCLSNIISKGSCNLTTCFHWHMCIVISS